MSHESRKPKSKSNPNPHGGWDAVCRPGGEDGRDHSSSGAAQPDGVYPAADAQGGFGRRVGKRRRRW